VQQLKPNNGSQQCIQKMEMNENGKRAANKATTQPTLRIRRVGPLHNAFLRLVPDLHSAVPSQLQSPVSALFARLDTRKGRGEKKTQIHAIFRRRA